MNTLLDLPAGIHRDIPAALYHQRVLGVVNKGALDQIAKTPAHYRAWVDGAEQPETPALVFGRALHALVLEPDTFAAEWAERPYFGDLRTKAGKEARDAWLAENPGKTLVDPDDWRRLNAMHEAITAHPVAGRLFVGGHAESTAIWTDPATGLLCKARYDYLRPDINVIADLKSTEDASPAGFARSVASYRYPVQQAHYTAAPAVLGGDRPAFLFVAIEKQPPHAVAVYQLDPDAAEHGARLRGRDMARLAECIEHDAWPSYPPEVTPLSLPAWAMKDAA